MHKGRRDFFPPAFIFVGTFTGREDMILTTQLGFVQPLPHLRIGSEVLLKQE